MSRSQISALGTASMMGLHLVTNIFVGGLLGYGIDYLLDTSPIGAGIGFFLGIIAGFRGLWIDAKRLSKDLKDA